MSVEYNGKVSGIEESALQEIGTFPLHREVVAGDDKEFACLTDKSFPFTVRYQRNTVACFFTVFFGYSRGKIGTVHFVYDHTHGTCVVGNWVDEYERAAVFVLLVRIEKQGFVRDEYGAGYFIQTHCFGHRLLHGVDIDFVFDLVDVNASGICRLLDKILLVSLHGFFVHPYEHGFEVSADVGNIVGVYEHFPAG